MKCQKCGKNEVSFRYSSNVNGCVTETNLCSQCATEAGYDFEQLFELGSFFDGMFPMRGLGGFRQIAIPMIQTSQMLPFAMGRTKSMLEQGDSCKCGCGSQIAKEAGVEVDEEMSLRRELNAQMRAAVAKEEFEKAAELRDRIKELETGRITKCDSETTSSDSPAAQ